MKRRLLTILLFLLAGAVVNVAVAWGSAFWLPLRDANRDWRSERLIGSETPIWLVRSAHRVGARWIEMWPILTDLQRSSALTSYPMREEPDEWWYSHAADPSVLEWTDTWGYRAIMVRGFPLPSPWCAATFGGKPGLVLRHPCSEVEGGIVCPIRPPSESIVDERLLPLRPLWPGFAVNTLFYTAVLWLPLCGPFVLRRQIRRRRGRCIRCGYDLRGDLDAGCPECGWNREESRATASERSESAV